ncbi:MAG TPA: hypothetical protein VGG25_31065 [Streptosporangiaceae bacterium]|jgi:hypothetical protein
MTPGALRGQDKEQEQGELAWAAVADAPELLRAEITKADGRRLTVYRRRDADRR